MQRQKTFGCRPALQPQMESRSLPSIEPETVTKLDVSPVLPKVFTAPPELSADVGKDFEEWKVVRKTQRRTSREPWRSVSIVAGIGFGLSSWILPDTVAQVAQAVTTGLAGASFLAGYRRTPTVTPAAVAARSYAERPDSL
jgi:hypothetical protein